MTSFEQKIYDEVLRDHPAVVEFRRDLHRHPEIAREEFRSQARIEEELDKIGLAHWRSAGTGVMAKLEGTKPGPVLPAGDGRPRCLVLRADTDALPVDEKHECEYKSEIPDRMHACGHDGHTAMLLSLCQWLSAKPEGMPRNVLAVFQPSEETTGGAGRICDSGILEEKNVKRIFGLHLWPGLPKGEVFARPGPMMARSNEVTVYVNGKSAHLSRAEQGRDAMLAGVEYLTRAYKLAEEVPPPCVLRFGKMWSGTVRNAVSGETTLEGSLRTYRDATFEACRDGLGVIGAAIERETGCHVATRFGSGYPAVWNHEALYEEVCAGLGEDAPKPLDKPSLAAEDFSFYQRHLPGVFFFLGIGDTPELHASNFDFDDEYILPLGVEFLKKLARLP